MVYIEKNLKNSMKTLKMVYIEKILKKKKERERERERKPLSSQVLFSSQREKSSEPPYSIH